MATPPCHHHRSPFAVNPPANPVCSLDAPLQEESRLPGSGRAYRYFSTGRGGDGHRNQECQKYQGMVLRSLTSEVISGDGVYSSAQDQDLEQHIVDHILCSWCGISYSVWSFHCRSHPLASCSLPRSTNMAAELGHLGRAAAAILCMLISHVAPSDSHAQARISGEAGTCINRERDALLYFKKGLLDPASRLSSWHGEDCCRWEGIRCSKRTGHIVRLDLRNTNENDEADSDLRMFSFKGEMAPSLAALQQLRYLDLSRNDFYGASIPLFMGSLENLRYLNLSSSSLSGRIPSQLGNLSNLRYLDVGGSDNYLDVVDLAWLSRLSLLSYLDLSSANLSPVQDWFHMVNMLSSLKVLQLSNCGLNNTWSATSKSNLTHLQVLGLSGNQFNSSLEHNWFFWDLTSLKELHLSDCAWHGPIPEQLGNMTSLQVINFDYNDLVGLIPSNLENLCNLKELYFDYKNLNVSIGDFLNQLPRCSWSTIKVLSLRDTNMTGKLLTSIGNMTRLSVLDASANMITGTIPLEVGGLGNLTELDLSYNKLNGVLMKEHFSGLPNNDEFDRGAWSSHEVQRCRVHLLVLYKCSCLVIFIKVVSFRTEIYFFRKLFSTG